MKNFRFRSYKLAEYTQYTLYSTLNLTAIVTCAFPFASLSFYSVHTVAVARLVGNKQCQRQYSQQLRIWIFESDSSRATSLPPFSLPPFLFFFLLLSSLLHSCHTLPGCKPLAALYGHFGCALPAPGKVRPRAAVREAAVGRLWGQSVALVSTADVIVSGRSRQRKGEGVGWVGGAGAAATATSVSVQFPHFFRAAAALTLKCRKRGQHKLQPYPSVATLFLSHGSLTANVNWVKFTEKFNKCSTVPSHRPAGNP